MLSRCELLKNIDLSNFNFQNITNMCFMFYKCGALTNIKLSNFKSENANMVFPT